MTTKQEIAKLREIERVYQNGPERVAAYNRRKWILLLIAWFLIFVAVFLSLLQVGHNIVCLAIAAAGGSVVGLAAWFAAASKQVPLLVRYTSLRADEIRKRLEELKDA